MFYIRCKWRRIFWGWPREADGNGMVERARVCARTIGSIGGKGGKGAREKIGRKRMGMGNNNMSKMGG